ncbi:fungal-specific transcription factor domain-containing protein [Aspergillus pseudonomiae]|uniref:Fungal-specific transcription factor domain-containing protein n=1 Tax=Aspergillus pseudonomiae TaxID=1506151 RepID=A0A5N7DGP0_9EURO|nr:fungal-specific transcription factor domain-containing protein [Aspergillus pseudonomiae]KAE8404828.1 fungal-specific transcription factor domain-containing protein [Aspergillus pseudonomiae]
MDPARKRQKVSSACERCRKRKLGCDQQRPCQLCLRAGVTCVPRGQPVARAPPTIPIVAPAGQRRSYGEERAAPVRLNDRDTAVLPELNIVDLSTRIFSRDEQHQALEYDTSALPGGRKTYSPLLSSPMPWRDAIGTELPDRQVLDELVTQFFDSVDWFMMVFHEGSFRHRYESLIASEHVAAPDSNFLWLVLLVLALGAHYSSLSEPLGENLQSLSVLSEKLLTQIEYRFLQIIGCPNVEAVQVCVLLGSFHLFNGRPTVGMGVLGSGIKIAQVIGLHRESMWHNLSEVARESRRRSWWALEVFDKYAAVAFGRPCSIDDSDCNIDMVTDVGEVSPRQSPLLTYHQWKFKLYRLMGPFLGRRLQTNRLDTVKVVHDRLVTWERELPDSLRLETYKEDDKSGHPPLIQLAALALQLTYDNLRIILHRSVAFGDIGPELGVSGRIAESEGPAFSRQQLLEASLRTSELYRYSHLLKASRRTHAVMHIGICLFTSGVVLCALSLMEPLSITSQKAKAGIMQIIRLQKERVSNHHVLSLQSVRILEDLVNVVMQAEQRIILGDPTPASISKPRNREKYVDNGYTDFSQTQANADVGSSTAVTAQTSLTPLQEVFANHTQPPSSQMEVPTSGTSSSTWQDAGGLGPMDSALDSSAGFSWDGNISSLVDSGLADASQLWLWSDNLGYQSFAELSDILH